MARTISIEKCEGGYIVIDEYSKKILQTSLETMFEYLLLRFEGRSKHFAGSSYGLVRLDRGANQD